MQAIDVLRAARALAVRVAWQALQDWALQHDRGIEIYPASEEPDGFRIEADMLLFASSLGRPREDETPEANPERLVRLVAGGRFATDETGMCP